MFDGILQPTHLILILVIVLIIFGPGKLPELGKSLGQSIRELRESATGHPEPANEQPDKPAGSGS
jgi:sec-independent protein translocase protein TatA